MTSAECTGARTISSSVPVVRGAKRASFNTQDLIFFPWRNSAMSFVPNGTLLSAVCKPCHLSPSFHERISNSNFSIIVDVSDLLIENLAEELPEIPGGELKISLEQFFSPRLRDNLQGSTFRSVWVEFFPKISSFYQVDSFLKRAEELAFLDCRVVSGDLELLHTCFEQPKIISGLAVKGIESSGYVSSETILSLLTHFEKVSAAVDQVPEIDVWGGVFTPEGAAACLASGVSRVVFEHLHCLTEQMSAGKDYSARPFSRLNLAHTTVIDLGEHICFRAFDKGNSRAVRNVRELIRNEPASEGGMYKIAAAMKELLVHPLSSDFSEQQLIPLGPEAASAELFVNRFGRDMFEALRGFAAETDRLIHTVPRAVKKMLNGGLRDLLKVRYPFIQGAMSWISDVPEFALSIARAGGLPTIALGIRSVAEIERDFGQLSKMMHGYSYAINVITLPENHHLEEHLSWVETLKPPFVVISAGDPGYGVRLQEKGIEVIYVTADIDLLKLAWGRGIRVVVCEGMEAGGHVGAHSTLTLAQAAAELRRELKGKTGERFLVLAGGICNAGSLFRAARLGADGVQMGTLYLFSEEAVSSGALSTLYQRTLVESSFGGTVCTGESVGLSVRSLVSPKTEKLKKLEKEIRSRGTDSSADGREQLEEESVWQSAYCGTKPTSLDR